MLRQREGIDFGESCPTFLSSSFERLLDAIASELDMDLLHFDVDQAFVQSHFDEDVLLRLPKE